MPSLKFGIKDTSRFDRLLLSFSLFTIVIWILTKDNALITAPFGVLYIRPIYGLLGDFAIVIAIYWYRPRKTTATPKIAAIIETSTQGTVEAN